MAVPVLPWRSFLDRFDWRAGEHVTLLGQTGSGKSYLAAELLALRTYSVVLGTKPRDDSLKRFARSGWKRRVKWPPPTYDQRVLLWPSMQQMADIVAQRDVMREALESIYTEGAWCVYVDELPYFTRQLGLGSLLELYWLQGRALGISLVAAAQRPVWIPLEALTQATHVFLWRQTEKRDLQRMTEIGGNHDTDEVAHIVRNLPPHSFLYLSTSDGSCGISRAPNIR